MKAGGLSATVLLGVALPFMSVVVFQAVFVLTVSAADELHVRIDRQIVAAAKGEPVASSANDATFVRRIFLDLAGRVPSWQEATQFLASREADKRVKLISDLLARPDYARRMQDLFNAMLLERRGENAEWMRFLHVSFETNKPWDQLVREVLHPDPNHETTRGAAFFHTKRLDKTGQQETDYPGLTRDVGRLFLGMDLQCAQCHNHLFIDPYKQHDFQGLFAVYQNTFIRSDVTFPAIGEKVMTKKLDFMSVFDKLPLATGPRVPGGKEIEIVQFEKGQEFFVPPDRSKNFLGTPKFSPLEALANELPVSSNRAFVDNIVNRLWFVMLGHGLVTPLDQHHVGNPSSHPELMEELGREFVAHGLDLKWMIRELALTEAYQRSSEVPADGNIPPLATYRIANVKRLSAEQIMASVLVATGGRDYSPTIVPAVATATTSVAEQTPEAKKVEPTKTEKLRMAFVKSLANAPQDPEIEFAPSLQSSLFMLNDAAVLDVLTPQANNLIDRLLNQPDTAAIADELYLCVLTRTPTSAERAVVASHLAKHADRRSAAITNLAWSLLASTEFCINH